MPLLEAPAWTFDVERGPNCLFVRLHSPGETRSDMADIAIKIWQAVEQHFAQHVVLDMSDVRMLHSYLLGQLILLHKRIHSRGGTLRICGLSAANQDALKVSRLDSLLPNYDSREEAVMTGSKMICKPR